MIGQFPKMTWHFASVALVVALFAAGSARADMFEENWTHTSFDAATGNVGFEHDPDSPWEIVITDPNEPVTLNQSTILSDDVPVGTVYQFTIPNFFDPLPLKNIRVEMFGQNSGASGGELPFVMDIIGADSDFEEGGPAVPVHGVFNDGTKTSTLVIEHWQMFPNPDFETVKLFAPVEFELESIQIWTESIPEPATAALFALGGLVMVRRRRI